MLGPAACLLSTGTKRTARWRRWAGAGEIPRGPSPDAGGGDSRRVARRHLRPGPAADLDAGRFRAGSGGYPRETPVVTGEARLTGWRRSSVNPNLWETRAPGGWRFHELFVNGVRKGRARAPATGFFRCVGGPIKDHPDQLRFHAGRREGVLGARRRGGIGRPAGLGAIPQCDLLPSMPCPMSFPSPATPFPTTPSPAPAITSRTRPRRCGPAMAPG
jgi:hypothetical protein